MKLEIDDYFELGDKKYITLDEYTYMNDKYIFVDELDYNEEPLQNFKVFKCQEEGLSEEKNPDVLKSILKVFEENFNNKLKEVYDLIENK